MDSWEGAQLNTAKEILAYELTALVHGKEEAEKAQATARSLFAGAGAAANMPEVEISFDGDEIAILDLMAEGKIAPSKSEARRLVMQGGVLVNDEKITEISKTFTKEELDGAVLKKGKKNFYKIIVK